MQHTRYRIEPAGAADIADVVRLFKAYEAHIGVVLSYQDFASEVVSLPGKYAPPTGRLLVARNDGNEAIGCVALRALDAPRSCEMKRLFVLPKGRGLGLGRALANAIIDEARTLGYAEIKLDTLPTMQDAIALYRALGFVATEPYYATAKPGTLFMTRALR